MEKILFIIACVMAGIDILGFVFLLVLFVNVIIPEIFKQICNKGDKE